MQQLCFMENKDHAAVKAHLAKDEVLAAILETVEPYPLVHHKNICLRLCASIMSQQLSTKVAAVIYKRFLELYGGNEPTPRQILDTPFDALRAIGLSGNKVNYVHNVARHMIENQVDDEQIDRMSDEQVTEFFTAIKGVGRWTTEMLLMFTLGREDVFAPDDLGIQQSMIKLYGLDSTNKKELRKRMEEIASKWSPYRTWACFYLWKHKDAK